MIFNLKSKKNQHFYKHSIYSKRVQNIYNSDFLKIHSDTWNSSVDNKKKAKK